jgi:uncharacterized protein YfiM (DUF2279 family)
MAHMPAAAVPLAESAWNDARHAVVSFAAVAQGYGVGRAVGLSRDGATAAALGASVALGIGKELWDRRRSGVMSAADLAWDALGIALGAVLIGAMR